MSTKTHINARQIKAARALLDWSQEKLAEACDLSIATIRKIESGHISPRATTMGGIQQAFEGAGLEFIDPDGVRRKPEGITVYEGEEDFRKFFDDVYTTVAVSGGNIVIVCASEDPFQNLVGEYHPPRMSGARVPIDVKCILTENPNNTYCAAYCSYRFLSKHYVDSVPFYIYGDKYAVIVFDADPSPKITVLQSPVVADAFRRQFYSMWEKAIPLNPPRKNDSRNIKSQTNKKR